MIRLRRRRARWGSKRNPRPSTTTEITPMEWRIIRIALESRVRDLTTASMWPAVEAAQRVLSKVADRGAVR